MVRTHNPTHLGIAQGTHSAGAWPPGSLTHTEKQTGPPPISSEAFSRSYWLTAEGLLTGKTQSSFLMSDFFHLFLCGVSVTISE